MFEMQSNKSNEQKHGRALYFPGWLKRRWRCRAVHTLRSLKRVYLSPGRSSVCSQPAEGTLSVTELLAVVCVWKQWERAKWAAWMGQIWLRRLVGSGGSNEHYRCVGRGGGGEGEGEGEGHANSNLNDGQLPACVMTLRSALYGAVHICSLIICLFIYVFI